MIKIKLDKYLHDISYIKILNLRITWNGYMLYEYNKNDNKLSDRSHNR